ncbi:unnamed protein product [Ectocarpus sp. CCAP 1310/34]|nr:unnamed protein product [Ectocarpus sp. CCAP 1310/34]
MMSCMMVANGCFGRCFVAISANIVALGWRSRVIRCPFVSSLRKKNRSAMCLVLELNIALLATVNAPVLSLLMGTDRKVLNPISVMKLEM